MRIEDIERLVRLVADSGLGEIEVKMAGTHLRISRSAPRGEAGRPEVHFLPMPAGAPAGWGQPPAAQAPFHGPGAHPAVAAQSAASLPHVEEEGLHVLKASMVGTFYRRSGPEAAPFVKEGDVIKKGQVICILEAMKIMNEIESDVAGTVVRVFAEDSQPVEYGEKLMAIRPL